MTIFFAHTTTMFVQSAKLWSLPSTYTVHHMSSVSDDRARRRPSLNQQLIKDNPCLLNTASMLHEASDDWVTELRITTSPSKL